MSGEESERREGITRYASALVGLTRWWIEDPAYRDMMRRELAEGLHVQPPDWPRLFTTAYFHRSEELGAELAEAGLEHLETLAVEAPGWIAPQFEERWAEEGARQALLQVVRWLERDPVALGMSPHLMAIARKGGS